MRVKNMDAEFIANLSCTPGKRREEFTDGHRNGVPGLYVEARATAPGQGTYYFRYKDAAGKTRHSALGRTINITLDHARKKARELKAQITLGQYPLGEPKPGESAAPVTKIPTLAEYFDNSYYPYISSRNRGAKKSKQIFDLRIRPRFGALRLDEISREQIQVFHTSLLQDEGLAHSSANHHLRMLKTMYRRAIDWELTTQSPAARIALFREENKVEHYMDEVELSRLVQVLMTDPARNGCNVALFLLATGARLNEALTATWKLIDRTNRVWRVEASNSKSKRSRSIPLNDAAIAVLDTLGTEGQHECLFVTSKGERLKHIHAVWNRLRSKAKLPHLRLHDLRHQYASMLVNSGRTLYEVQAILGHQDPSVTTRYASLTTTTLQEAAGSAAAAINSAIRRSA